jgi:hypothetical protein
MAHLDLARLILREGVLMDLYSEPIPCARFGFGVNSLHNL